jgi:hypothetical protein
MLCLSDNDLLLNLAAWSLLEEFTRYVNDELGIPREEICVLDSFISQLEKGQPRWDKYGERTLERALKFCTPLPRIYKMEYDPAVLLSLKDIEDIDDGEAILTAVALKNATSIIATNDLRYIATLEADPAVTAYRNALTGRILHLRQVVRGLLDIYPSKHITPRISAAPSSDTRIRQAFGSSRNTYADLNESIEEVKRLGRELIWEKPAA